MADVELTMDTENSNKVGKRNSIDRTPDAEDVAHLIFFKYQDSLAYDRSAKTWRYWVDVKGREDGGTHWEAVEDSDNACVEIGVDAISTAGLRRTSALRNDAFLHAQRLLRRDFPLRYGLVNFANGTYDITSRSLRPHRKEDGLLYCLDYELSLSDVTWANCPTIKKFLDEVMPDQVAQVALCEHIGLAMLGDTDFQKSLILQGPPECGKTTVLRLVNLVMGQSPNNFAPHQIFDRELEGLRHRFNWYSKPIACFDEFPEEALRQEEIFKQCAVHSGITIRGLNKDAQDVQWRPKMLLACNDAPRFTDRTGAVARRFLVINFPKPVSNKDHRLIRKLTRERSAFAHLCIEAALEAIDRGNYSESETMRANLQEMVTEGDNLKIFISTRTVLGENHRCLSSDLYNSYKAWCVAQGINIRHVLSCPNFNKRITEYPAWGLEKPQKGRIGTRTGQVWYGIAPLDDEETLENEGIVPFLRKAS